MGKRSGWSRDADGSTSGTKKSKGDSTPPPPPSRSKGSSSGVEYTRLTPPLPSAPRSSRHQPSRNSKNSDRTVLSLDADAPPLGTLEVKKIVIILVTNKTCMNVFLPLIPRISCVHAGQTRRCVAGCAYELRRGATPKRSDGRHGPRRSGHQIGTSSWV